MGSLQMALPQPVDPETEEAMLAVLRRKLTLVVSRHVELLRDVEAQLGPPAVERLRQNYLEGVVARAAEQASRPTDRSLRAYCAALEAGCRGSHEWEKLVDSDVEQVYRFTGCMYADIYRELDATDLGIWLCQSDGPAAAAFHPGIHFRRTQTLMEGHPCCDHVFYVPQDLGRPG